MHAGEGNQITGLHTSPRGLSRDAAVSNMCMMWLG